MRASLPPIRVGEFQPHSAARGATPLSTLIVDDDPTSRQILMSMVCAAGHRAIAVDSAENAFSQFSCSPSDIVMMDVMLPGMDGITAMAELRRLQQQRWLPVVLVSADTSCQRITAGLRAGADDYLTKPFVFDHVVAKLKNIARTLSLQLERQRALHFADAVVNNMAEPLLCADRFDRIVSANPAAERAFAFAPGGLLGADINRLFPAATEDSRQSLGRPVHLLGTGVRADGTRFPLEAQHTTVLIDDQSITITTVRDITPQLESERRTINDAARLREYMRARDAENEFAKQMLDKLLRRDDAAAENVCSHNQSAAGFSGDVVASRRAPDGRLFIILADATGHGLAAAISLVPAISVLYAMAGRGRALGEIVAELNTKLREAIPAGRFLAAAILCVDEQRRSGEIWVGGMPPVLLLSSSGEVLRQFESEHFALGAVATADELTSVVEFSWEPSNQLLLLTDGVIEAQNPEGEQFGYARVIELVKQVSGPDRLGHITSALNSHLAGLPADDDASLVVVNLR